MALSTQWMLVPGQFCGRTTPVPLFMVVHRRALGASTLAVDIQLAWQGSIQLGLLELHSLPSVFYERLNK